MSPLVGCALFLQRRVMPAGFHLHLSSRCFAATSPIDGRTCDSQHFNLDVIIAVG